MKKAILLWLVIGGASIGLAVFISQQLAPMPDGESMIVLSQRQMDSIKKEISTRDSALMEQDFLLQEQTRALEAQRIAAVEWSKQAQDSVGKLLDTLLIVVPGDLRPMVAELELKIEEVTAAKDAQIESLTNQLANANKQTALRDSMLVTRDSSIRGLESVNSNLGLAVRQVSSQAKKQSIKQSVIVGVIAFLAGKAL